MRDFRIDGGMRGVQGTGSVKNTESIKHKTTFNMADALKKCFSNSSTANAGKSNFQVALDSIETSQRSISGNRPLINKGQIVISDRDYAQMAHLDKIKQPAFSEG